MHYDGDFAAAMFRLRARGAPDLFWTRYNRGHWVATSPSLIETVLISPDLFSSRAMRVPKESNPSPPILPLMLDPPMHIKYRLLLMGAMSPAALKRMTPVVRGLSIELVETLRPRGGCEFVRDFAQQMPIAVFLSMLDCHLKTGRRSWPSSIVSFARTLQNPACEDLRILAAIRWRRLQNGVPTLATTSSAACLQRG